MQSGGKFVMAIFLLVSAVLFHGASLAAEKAVLLPVAGPLTPDERAALAGEAASGLSGRYELIMGEDVDRFVKEVFLEESKKADCDEAACYRKIAARYNVEKIAAIRVAQKSEGGYLVTFGIYDVTTGGIETSRSRECSACTFERLKALCRELVKD